MREEWKLKREQPTQLDGILSIDNDDNDNINTTTSISITNAGESMAVDASDSLATTSGKDDTDTIAGTTTTTTAAAVGDDGVYESTHVSTIVVTIIV